MLSRILKLFGVGVSKATASQSPQSRPSHGNRVLVTVTHERVTRPLPPFVKQEISPGELLLKDAVRLKKEKRYDDACDAIRQAFALDAGKSSLTHRLQLPSYLVLAGKNDDAWRSLNEMNIEFTKPQEQRAIASKMAALLKKERKYRDALVHECWSYAMDVEGYRQFVERCIRDADREAMSSKTDELAWLHTGRNPYAKTPAGSPIYDCSFTSFNSSLKKRLESDAVFSVVCPLILLFSDETAVGPFSQEFWKMLKSPERPEFVRIRDLVASIRTQ